MNYFTKPLLLVCLFAALLVPRDSLAVTAPTLPQLQVVTDLASTPVTGQTIVLPAGGDLQAAINSAKLGDEIVLPAGASWTGNYELPAKSGTGWLTIRSSAIAKLPAPGTRVSPNDAVNMPRIAAASVGTAFHLAAGPSHANHYRLIGLEITEQPKQSLNYGLIMGGDPNDTNASDLPDHIIIDRCYVHGQKLSHIKFGWQMNGSYLAAIDSYFSEFHGLGQDTQAISGYMGTGPMKISNNFLSGAGENVLFGGAYDAIPNTTTSDVTFTNNFLYKPAEWFYSSPVPAPTGVAATVSPVAGTLAPATYYYSVIALGTLGTLDSKPGQAQSSRSTEAQVSVTSSTSSAAVTWTELTYGDSQDTRIADNYVVARTTDPPTSSVRSWTYFAYTPQDPNGTLSFLDSGSVLPLSNFSEWARYWSVKNLFEIKNGVRWLVDSNVLDGNWVSAQNGFSVLLTPRLEDVTMAGNHISDITFSNNVVRHVAGGINIGSEDDTHPCTEASLMIPTARVAFRNNLWQISYNWGGNGIYMQFGAGVCPTLPGVGDLAMDHNTIFQTWSNAGLGPASGPANLIGAFSFTNNVLWNGPYGWHFNGLGSDWASISAQFSSITLANNVWAAANPQYPGGNMFPGTLADVGFVNYNDGGDGGDFHLAASSPYRGKASDGKDPGADMDVLTTVMTNATVGKLPVPIQAPPPTPTPTVTVVPAPTLGYHVVNVNSHKCLTVQSDGTVKQYTCDATNSAQAFTLVPQFDSNQSFVGFEIQTNVPANGLDIWYASPANGTGIGVYKFKGSSNELFLLNPTAGGHFTVTSLLAPKSCLDMTALSTADGGNLEEWACNGGSNQAWDFTVSVLQ